MVDIQTVSIAVASTGVVIAAIYYIIILRHNMKARAMEMCRLAMSDYISEQALKRYATMQNMEWKDFEDFVGKYGFSNPEKYSIWMSWFLAWEMMGILLKNKIVRAEEVHDLGGYAAILAWEKFKDVIQRLRGTVWGQDVLGNAEFFAQEMLKVKLRRDASVKDKLKTLPLQPK